MLMKRIIKLLPIVAVLCVEVVSCDKDDNDDVKNPNIYLGHEYVDLGLKVKWATCNVGAEKPEEFGDYFAWGDTTTKYLPGYAQSESPQWKNYMWGGYSWENYRFCSETSNSLFKYCNDSGSGYDNYTDTLTILTPADDVAHYKWGGNWRMPTYADFYELLNNCNFEFTTQNGVEGMKVISKKDSSKSIFLPDAGSRNVTNLEGVGLGGTYWSSSLYKFDPSCALYLTFYPGYHFTSFVNRCYGLSVRPVCP